MLDSFKNKRIIFVKGEQTKFLGKSINKIGVSILELAKILNLSERTLSDWKREKFHISAEAASILSEKSGVRIPKNVKIENRYRHVRIAGKLGGIAKYKKYGRVADNEKYRKKKWEEWWKKEGKFIDNKIFKRKVIKNPKKTIALAEFVGIMLGDGGISKYQIKITLNSESDYKYSLYVINLIEKLFGVSPSVYKNKKFAAIDLAVSGINMVKFCQSIGLKIGNKVNQRVDIPDWIKKNKSFQIGCIRGLIDTDGSVFIHRYKSGNKIYNYKKLDFTSRSRSLLLSVYSFLKNLGFTPRITYDKYSIRLDNINDVRNYFYLINSSNPKHLNKFGLSK